MTHSVSCEGNFIQIFLPLQYGSLKVSRNVTLNSTPLIPNVLVLEPLFALLKRLKQPGLLSWAFIEANAWGHSSEQLSSSTSREMGADGKFPGDNCVYDSLGGGAHPLRLYYLPIFNILWRGCLSHSACKIHLHDFQEILYKVVLKQNYWTDTKKLGHSH